MIQIRFTLLTCLMLVACSIGTAEEPTTVKSLFNGENLDGWQVQGCEAVVQNGAILLKSGNGIVYANQKYQDFVLELDWKALKEEKWDSGIYIRCELPPKGKPWPKRYQVNLLQGQEGNLLGIKGATSKGLTKDHQWNHFKLIVHGKDAELEINGKPAWKGTGLEITDGYIAFQSEVPGGGQFEFKNITIAESK